MASPATFWPEALPYALEAHAATGVLTSVILAQWAGETGYGGPDWSVYHNPGNVGNPAHAGQTNFDTLEEGVQAYIKTMHLGYYVGVLSAVGYINQSRALGQSPWAATHYNAVAYYNGVRGAALLANAGIDLINIINIYNLTRYDGAPVPAPPTPSPAPPASQEDSMNCTDPTSGGTWIVDPTDGHVETLYGAPYLGGLNSPPDANNWQQVGVITGITSFKAADGQYGYSIIVKHTKPLANGAWYSGYTFPRK